MRVILSILLSCLSASGASYFIDFTGGNDGSAGTSSGTAWKTFAPATNVGNGIVSGDTVFLKRGEVWTDTFSFPTNGVTLDAYGSGALPVIKGGGTLRRVVNVGVMSNTITRNIQIQDGGGGTGANWLANNGTNWLLDCVISNHTADACASGNGDSHSVVSNCFIAKAFDDGLTLHTTSSAEMYSCIVSNCTQGLNNSGTDMSLIVTDCLFKDNANDVGGLSICPATFSRCRFAGKTGGSFVFIKDDSGSTINFNYCTFDGSQGTGAADAEFTPQGVGEIHLNNCVLYGGGVAGKMSLDTTSVVKMTNCILSGWARAAAFSVGSVMTHDHCIFYNVAITNWTSCTSFIGTADPLFISSSNFRLQAGSPAINAGTYIGLATDLDGNPVSNPPEVGAYEFGVVYPRTAGLRGLRGF